MYGVVTFLAIPSVIFVQICLMCYMFFSVSRSRTFWVTEMFCASVSARLTHWHNFENYLNEERQKLSKKEEGRKERNHSWSWSSAVIWITRGISSTWPLLMSHLMSVQEVHSCVRQTFVRRIRITNIWQTFIQIAIDVWQTFATGKCLTNVSFKTSN